MAKESKATSMIYCSTWGGHENILSRVGILSMDARAGIRQLVGFGRTTAGSFKSEFRMSSMIDCKLSLYCTETFVGDAVSRY
jgi:hypothetical protein